MLGGTPLRPRDEERDEEERDEEERDDEGRADGREEEREGGREEEREGGREGMLKALSSYEPGPPRNCTTLSLATVSLVSSAVSLTLSFSARLLSTAPVRSPDSLPD